jgi:hypothetical protein
MFDILFLLPVAITIIVAVSARVFWDHTNTWTESITQVLLILLIITPVWAVGRYSDAYDTELWNGEITRKQVQRESCPQYWSDSMDGFCTEYNTRRVKDGPPRRVCSRDEKGREKNCRTEQDYKTQYYYIYPWEQKFHMFTNVKVSFDVPRVDRQGAITPPDYVRHYVGEPVADAKPYTNWIRAASANVFYEDGAAEDKYEKIMPAYPLNVYDYGNIDRIVRVGNVPSNPLWNDKLRSVLKVLGPQKQMNVVVVLVDAKIASADFSNALRRYWMGFKKNDAVLFIGLDGENLAWSEVMSWSKRSIFDINMRDDLNSYMGKPIDFMKIMDDLQVIALRDYERREMKEFEYLKDQIPVPTWLTILVFIVSLGGSAGLTLLFSKIDFDPIETLRKRM